MSLLKVMVIGSLVLGVGVVVANCNVISSMFSCEGRKVPYTQHTISGKNTGLYFASSYSIEGNCIKFLDFMGEHVLCGNVSVNSYTMYGCEK